MDKYYTPNVEELFVGYECFWIKDPSKEAILDNLIPIKFTAKSLAFAIFSPVNWEREETTELSPNLGSYYTLLLSKEDIIKCNWQQLGLFKAIKEDESFINFNKAEFLLKWYVNINFTEIYEAEDCIFAGELKSINELRTIQKYLNI